MSESLLFLFLVSIFSCLLPAVMLLFFLLFSLSTYFGSYMVCSCSCFPLILIYVCDFTKSKRSEDLQGVCSLASDSAAPWTAAPGPLPVGPPGENTGGAATPPSRGSSRPRGWKRRLFCLRRWQVCSLPLVPPGEPASDPVHPKHKDSGSICSAPALHVGLFSAVFAILLYIPQTSCHFFNATTDTCLDLNTRCLLPLLIIAFYTRPFALESSFLLHEVLLY